VHVIGGVRWCSCDVLVGWLVVVDRCVNGMQSIGSQRVELFFESAVCDEDRGVLLTNERMKRGLGGDK
jgi:hypothetical protein